MTAPTLRTQLTAEVHDPETTDLRHDDDQHGVTTENLLTRALVCTDPLERQRLLGHVVLRHLPLAQLLAARYHGRGESPEDLLQVARLGLVLAVERYLPQTQVPFVAFAVPTVLGELRRHFRDHCWIIRPPRRLQELRPRALRSQERLTQELGRAPTVNEVAEDVGSELADIIEALTLGSAYSPESLDASRPGAPTVAETLISSGNPLAQVEDRLSLEPVLGDLPGRTRRVLHLRYAEECSQRQIAERIGVSQMQVSRILRQALTGMRCRELTAD
jgi:RNA polymerase sigma-B factor